ncbi:MAG: fibronectin type III domain-containing protein, partial [Candidatus Moraniibacteriota bacterium]
MENKIYTKKRNLSRGELGRVLVYKTVKILQRKSKLIGICTFVLATIFLAWNFLPISNKHLTTQPKVESDAYDFQLDKPQDGYSIDFSQIKNPQSEIQVGKTNVSEVKEEIEIKNGDIVVKAKPQIATEIIHGNAQLQFKEANIKLKKTGPVNAIITCQSWDEKNNVCQTSWELAKDVALSQDENNISFSVKHFSAYAGVYLEIVNVQSNLTQGDDWTVNFNTYGQSDLKIEATDGTNFDSDIQFKSISCGDTQIPDNQIEKVGNIITVRNYKCDNETSNIKNIAITAGRHWLAFTFGETEKVLAHNFACNSGTLNDTCTVSSVQTMANGDTISGTGSLVVASGGNITSVAGNRFDITMTGDVTIQSGGTITGNATITAANVTVASGGSINVNNKGYAGGNVANGSGPGGGGGGGGDYTFGGGGGYGGVGGNGSAGYAGGITYGSITGPTDLGSGGGGAWSAGAKGGAGGGAIKIVAGGIANISGSITANGESGLSAVSTAGGGGSGGSIWIQSGTLTGSGLIAANGGGGNNLGNGGGGGRIVLDPATSDIFIGSITTTAVDRGELGTVVRDIPASLSDIIISSNASWIGTIKDSSGNPGNFTFNSLTINSGITLTASVSIVTVDYFTLNSTAVINANTLGFGGGVGSGGSGPGGGGGGGGDGTFGGGGGYGGVGGNGSAGYAGGVTYGLTAEPSQLGSGGGGAYGFYARGGAGGGAIKIVAGGAATISGSITANGGNGISFGSTASGGGSGGSIWIQSGTLSGTGSMTARGGNGGTSSAGGGGGGRIAVSCTSYGYGGSFTVASGTGGSGAAVGTIYGLGPISTITAPSEGNYKNATFTTITGTTVSPVGTLSGVQVSIKDVTDGTHWYNGSDFTTATSEQWLNATGTTSWTFNMPTLTQGHVYLIRSKAADNTAYSPETPGTGTSFTYDNVGPTSTITAPADNADLSSLATITGTAEDTSSGVASVQVSIKDLGTDGAGATWYNGSTFGDSSETWQAASGTTSWTYTAPTWTHNHQYLIRARAVDNIANTEIPGAGNTFHYWEGAIISSNTTITSDQTYANLWVTNNAVLTVDSINKAGGAGQIVLTVTGDLIIDVGASINADGKGYAGGTTGNGSGTGGGAGGAGGCCGVTSGGAGGGYGGAGGRTYVYSGGTTYGSATAPIDLGSGGGALSSFSLLGGAGGGALKIVAAGEVILNGSILANGIDGGNNGSYSGGGGSGGSVWLQAGNLTGSGSINTNGGSAVNASVFAGGGGGGGRIAIYPVTSDTFTGSITASPGTRHGVMGTVVRTAAATPADLVIADNISWIGFIKDADGDSGSFVFNNLTINSGITLTASASITALNDFTLNPTAIINSTGLGYPGGVMVNGIGSGGGGWTDNPNWPAGAGGGGYGGAGAGGYGAGGGSAYGSSSQPNDLGSGGGGFCHNCGANYQGGNGGGAIHITAGGILTVSGSIIANGAAAAGGAGAGGGSGGSVWLQAGTLAGSSGSISASGGGSSNGAGGGGGGRVALHYANKTYTGSIAVLGGTGGFAGTAGTIYDLSSTVTAPINGALESGNPIISGIAVSTYGSLTLVEILVKDNTANNCWDGSAWAACPTDSADWPDATGTATWSYTGLASINYIHARTYTVRSRATDNSGMELPSSGNTFTYNDTVPPTSTITAPADNVDLSALATITGTAEDVNSAVASMQVSIKDLGTDGTGETWYNGSTFGDSSETWQAASGTTSWTYTAPTWTHNHFYLIRSKATDVATNVETPATGNTFYYWNGTIISTSVALSGSYTNLLVNNGSSPTIAGNTTITVSGDLRVKSNSNIITNSTNTNQSSGGVGVTINANNITIDSGSTINANGTGYLGGASAGSGPGAGVEGGSGAGYGGAGGPGNNGAVGGAAYGVAQAPTELGSGGGGYCGGAGYGGNGGGAIKIVATGTATISGAVTANGLNGISGSGCSGGGGSGGSIWIQAGTLTGTGSMTAAGGNGANGNGIGGNGGGGRIATSTFSGSVIASAGTGASGGEMGTIAVTAPSLADVTIDSNTNWIGVVKDASGDNPGSFTFNSLTINSGVTLTANASITTVDNFTLNSTAIINATAIGYPGGASAGFGPGAGADGGSGAGHGGVGGPGNSGAVGGAVYGVAQAPTELGSGGGGHCGGPGYGGAGGGAIKIAAGGVLTIDGSIVANGSNGISNSGCSGGGGSGGSIWIQTGTLAGSTGVVTANGGGGANGSGIGGNGGGGRIAVYYTSYAYSGSFAVAVGVGGTGGAVGTIYGLSPTSIITAPTEGNYKNATFTTITGTAVSPVGTLSGVQVSIKDVTDGTHWYNGSDFTTATSEQWLNATGTTSWTFSMPTLTQGHVYLIRSKAADNTAYSPETPGIGTSFTYDNAAPTSAITAPADNADLSALTTITGTATDAASGVTSVQVSIKDLGTDGTGETWYNGSTFSDSSETWQAASGTTSWTYTAPAWTHNHQYLIRAKAIDTISNEEIPEVGNTFLFWNGTIISTSVALSGSYTNLLVTNGSSPTIAGNTTITVSGDLRVRNSSNIIANSTNTNQDSGGVGVTIDAGNVTIDSGSTINANGTGYASDHGPGRGLTYTGNGWYEGAGAGYGGAGGDCAGYGGRGNGGATYGNATAPTDLGSGGGLGGGIGGGAIKLNVTAVLANNGTISSNGAAVAGGNGGGGSGGSVWIVANSYTGGGAVRANGGAAFHSDDGSGGGGRIYIAATNNIVFSNSANIHAARGMGSNLETGQGGTIYVASSGGDISLVSATLLGGTIDMAAANIGMDASSNINGDYQGYIGSNGIVGNGPGGGAFSSDNGWYNGGGGGHGGKGGDGYVWNHNVAGGAANGSEINPVSPGSGGGLLGNGGGVIRLNASNTLTLNGMISADGESTGGSGGAGGSIWCTGATIAGTGFTAKANGGTGVPTNGGGGGGRISFTGFSSFSAVITSVSVSGGTGNQNGAEGTINGLKPSSVILSPSDGSYVNNGPTFSGTAASVMGVLAKVEILVKDITADNCWNGSGWAACPSDLADWPDVVGTATWAYTGLSSGNYTNGHSYIVRSRATDNSSTPVETPSAGTSFTYDNTAPTTAVTITDAQYNTAGWNSTSTINGTASDATSGVTLTEITIMRQDGSPNHWWNGTDWNATSETWLAVTTGTAAWYYTLSEANLTDGKTYTVKARATDAAGNITTTGFGTDDFAYDTTPPTTAVTLSNSYYNATTWNQASTINGTASDVTSSIDNVQLEIQDNTDSGNYWTGSIWSSTETWLSASGTDTWSYDLDKTNLTSGHNYTITARATDSAGNLMSINYATGDFNYDSVAPVISFVDDVSSSPTQNDTINITISDSFPDATSFKYLLSPDTDCSSKNYALGVPFNSGVAFNFATEVNNNKYICVRADDLAGNVSYLVSGNVLNIDITVPASTITNPDGTTPEYYQMSSITGTASDNNSLGTIYVSIKDTTDGTHWWSGTDWSVTDENSSWLPATSTTNWSFNSTGVLWSVNNSYLIKSKAVDTAGNNEIPASGNSFTFVNSSPVVSNLTATQKNDGEANAGKVEVNYDVTDLESSATTVNLFYASGATLDSTIINGTTTNNILTSDISHFPDSGTIIIKSGTGATTRYEYIAYTGKSANYLTGITRHTEGTVGIAHDAGEEILIKANSLSGDFGSVNNGTGKALIWDAATDTSFYESALTVRISANDGASTNNIGLADSATFEFDTKKPAVTSANLDAREAIPGGTPATLNLNVSDDTAKQMLISLNADFSGATWVAYTNTPTITLTTNPDTVYLKFKDAKGNTTDDQILTTPNTPGSVMIQDISSAAQNKWRLYVSWQIISTPAPGFDAYQVYRAASQNGTYSYLGATVADNINADYYSDTVNFDDTYYYKVTSKDDNGNYSFYSNYMHGTANAILDAGEGGGGTGGDVTPPQILTGPTATPTNNAASITWTTDEIADSYIEYGADTSYGSVFGISTNGTDHSVTLPETLSGSTLYHYRVRARDIAGNLTLSTDFNFTTTAGGDTTSPTISLVTSTSITSTTATITFTTNENSSSYIDYGTTQNVYTKTTGNSADNTTTHTVNLTALTPNTTYYYRVRSVDSAGNEATDANSGNYSFQTLNSPTITNVSAINVTDTNATITYETSANAYGFVDYGVTNSYGQVRGDDANVHTNQSIQLANLTPGTTYHYRPRIKDIYGNYTFDATDYTFETISSDAPVLQSLTSTTTDGIYGPTSSINITATYNQTLAANSSMAITLNTGVQLTLTTIDDTKLTGTYTIGATGSNQNTNALAVSTIALQNVCNANTNCLTGTTLPGENINTHSTLIIDTTAPVFSSITPDNSGNIASLTTSSDISY